MKTHELILTLTWLIVAAAIGVLGLVSACHATP